MVTIRIPSKLRALINEEHRIIIEKSLIPFSHLLQDNNLFFFPEYTDHGINHIEAVLRSIENLISDDTFDKLSSLDICAIIVATVLHDIGLHASPELFRNMLAGKYDYIPNNLFKEKRWADLWDEYLKASRFWNQEKKYKVFGNKDYAIKEPNLDDLQLLDQYDKRFIGEFIRIHHARLAYEIALKGFIGDMGIVVFDFNNNHILNNKKFMQLAGLIARSHGMNDVRDTFEYLLKLSGKASWKNPLDIKVVFLMTLIRIADFIQIDANRTDELMFTLRTINSPYSLREHKQHLAIDCVLLDNNDKKIVVEASPKDAQTYVKINNLVQDIQKEFDISWSILGEVYGDKYKLRYHYIVSNLNDEVVKNGFDFVPDLFNFEYNNNLADILIGSLYGNNPSYGVRELVQNAVDACRTRMAFDDNYKKQDITHVTVSFDSKSKIFTIVDTGIGMTIEEIKNYFLTIGSSFNDNIEWKKTQDTYNTYRTGRFGIGILAAFLLGKRIKVKTKSIKSKSSGNGYEFNLALGQAFLQINKVSIPDYGTTIEISCDDNVLLQLEEGLKKEHYLGTNKWFGWYVGSSPKVVYIHNEEPIKLNSEYIKRYKPLPTSIPPIAFDDIHWEPEFLFGHSVSVFKLLHNPWLFCNGFFITDNSLKKEFSSPDIKKFIPPAIPNLIFCDIFNQVPLNIQRTNISYSVEYYFERELAIAKCKDILCQLLAIEESIIKTYDYSLNNNFFYNQSGYVLNQYKDYFNLNDCNAESQYEEKCFYGKKLVHVYYGIDTSLNLPFWEKFISEHPEAFFSFIPIGHDDNKRIQELLINGKINHDLYHYSSVVPVLTMDSINDKYENYHDLEIEDVKKHSKRMCHAYGALINDSFNDEFVNDLIDQLDRNTDAGKDLLYFAIHNITGNNEPSFLDDFITEYASGNMIVPYNETERKKKFEVLYKECGKEIEQYREHYNELCNRYRYK